MRIKKYRWPIHVLAASLALGAILTGSPALADDGQEQTTSETVINDGSGYSWEESLEVSSVDSVDDTAWELNIPAQEETGDDYQAAATPLGATADWQFTSFRGCVLNMRHQVTFRSDGWVEQAAGSNSPSSGACSPDGQKPRVIARVECFNSKNVNINTSASIALQGAASAYTIIRPGDYSYCDSVHRISYNGMKAPSDWGDITFRIRIFAGNAVQVWRCTDAGKCVQAG